MLVILIAFSWPLHLAGLATVVYLSPHRPRSTPLVCLAAREKVSRVNGMAGPNWNLSGGSLAALQFAERLVDDGSPINFRDMTADDPEWAAAEARGWVETVHPNRRNACEPGFRPYDWPRLTSTGRLKVDEVRSLRGDARARGSACREALLIWLATDGRGAVSADLLVEQDAYRFYDTPFRVDEVNEAGKFLVDTGLVRAIGVWGPDIVRPVLRAEGQQCVEFYDGDVRAFLNPTQPGGSVTNNQENNFYAEGAQAAQGQNVTQTQNNAGIDAAALAAIFQAMRDALSSVEDEDNRGDLEHAIRELEVAAEDGDPDEVKQHAGRLQRLASPSGSRVGVTGRRLWTAR